MCYFFWTPWFLMRNLLSFELLFPFRYCVISLWLLSRFFSLFFVFRSLIMWLIVDFFGFILFRVHSASCICRFMSIPKFRKFRGIIFSNIFPSYTFFPSPSGTPVTQILELLLFHCVLRLFVFFSFFSLPCSVSVHSVFSFPFCHLHSALELIWTFFFFSDCSFSSKSSIWLFLVCCISLLRLSIFSFVSNVHNWLLEYF